jgi:HSP20 family molecular chaperone IbpA
MATSTSTDEPVELFTHQHHNRCSVEKRKFLLAEHHPYDHYFYDNNELEQHHHTANVTKFADGRYQICIDVHLFTPADVSVKTTANTVIIEASHDEKPDEFGYVERHFVRKYPLAEEYALSDVSSTLSSDGVLTVTVTPPKKVAEEHKMVPIHRTGPVRFSHEKFHEKEPHQPFWH